jgi:PAS domain S-box-containing protein
VWAQHAPEHFANRAAIVSAELARLQGRYLDAESLYEEAIRLTREHRFVQNEGITNELAARFYAARGLNTIADENLRSARNCYLRWGADGKVRYLEQLHPQLRDKRGPLLLTSTVEARQEQLDFETVVKMSQTLSGEIVLDRLIETLMQIALEHAGAERGLLVLARNGKQRIEAEAATGREKMVRLTGVSPTSSELPDSILQHVVRTRESVMLDDVCAPNPFSEDPYIGQQHPRSLLCLALVKQTMLIGVLYLENRLASHVFTPARYSVLSLLSSQAAISLDNARLYAELTAENVERRRTDDALRREVLERQRAEQVARMEAMRFRGFFDLPLIGMAVTSPERRFLEVNDKLCQIVGYPREELIGRDWASITHPDDLAGNLALLEDVMTGTTNTYSMDKRYIHRDGHLVYVGISVCCVRRADGPADHFVLTVQDVTARYRVQGQLQTTEAHLKHAQQVVQIASYEAYPPEFFATVWSKELRDIFGLQPDAPIPGRDEYIERFVHADDRPYLREALRGRGKADRRSLLEYRIVRPDNTVRYIQTVADPVKDESGRVVQLVGTILDITERKLSTERLELQTALLDRLFQSVAEATVLLDLDDCVLRANTEFTRMFGYTAEQAVGRRINDLVVPAERMAEAAALSSNLANGQMCNAESLRRRADGSCLQVSILGAPISSGGRQIASYAIYRDITERKRVEQALRESEERFALAVAGANVGIFDWDLTTDRLFLSVRAQELFGLDSGEPWRSRAEWSKVFRPIADDMDLNRRAIRAHLAGETPACDVEYRLMLPSGDCRWFRHRGLASRDATGKPYRMAGSIEDITERKLAEWEMIRVRDLHAALSETNRAIIHIREPRALFEEVCRVAVEFGHFCQVWAGLLNEETGWIDVLGPRGPASSEFPSVRVSIDPNIPEGRGYSGAVLREGRHYVVNDYFADPRVAPWAKQSRAAGIKSMVTLPLKRHGRTVGVLSVHADEIDYFTPDLVRLLDEITMSVSFALEYMEREALRAEAESELRKSEARFRSLTELSSDWYWEQDENMRFTYLSSLFHDLTGYSPADSIGKARWELENIAPVSSSWDEHKALLDARRPFRDLELRRVTQDGAVRYLSISGAPVFDQQGRFRGYEGVGRNMTERKRVEEALHQAQAELAHVARVTSLGALTASIAHEVNQPLTGIINNAGTCLRMLNADPPNIEGARETTRRTLRDGNRAAEVITRLRALFAKKDPVIDAVDLNEATREVIAMSSAELQRGRVAARLELADDLSAVAGDRVQLQQVILNLVLNATDAMSAVEDRPRQLVIKTERDQGDQVRLSVQDAGVGLDPGSMDNLFDAFYSTKPDGMGIGLSVSRSIIERHHGRLWAEPNRGPGATFSFAIPYATEDAAHAAGNS